MGEEPNNHLFLSGDVLEYRHREKLVWQIRARSIVLIAEHTNNQGPLLDDYFLHFWTREGDKLFEAQVTHYVPELDKVLLELSNVLRAELKLGLTGSTDWNSIIIWPPQLAGQKYYKFVEVGPPTLWRRLKRRLLGPSCDIFLTEQVQNYLTSFKGVQN
jgi:hypothetical protein